MFAPAELEAAALAASAEIVEFSLHTAGDVTASTDEATITRVTASWSNDGGGTVSALASFSGGTAGLAVTRVGYWRTGSVYAYGMRLPAGTALSSTGDLEVTVTETGFSS